AQDAVFHERHLFHAPSGTQALFASPLLHVPFVFSAAVPHRPPLPRVADSNELPPDDPHRPEPPTCAAQTPLTPVCAFLQHEVSQPSLHLPTELRNGLLPPAPRPP